MADKRMFSKKIIETDRFLSLPLGSQILYVHLSMYADDDGFVDSVSTVMQITKTKKDDLFTLIKTGYVLQVSEYVYVIAHWHINNYLAKDRFKPTIYEEEKAMLCRPNNVWKYREGVNEWRIPDPDDSDSMYTENRKEKKKKEEVKHKHGVYGLVLLTDAELEKLVNEFPFDYQSRINDLDGYLHNNPKKHYADHYYTILKWAKNDQPKRQPSFADMVQEGEIIDL